ncbi:MAG: hypothetical protein JW724_07325 [Candidatus Altiarchaeota archaeon]|nr:hypothetical protein [Candidatus Altiarchaeota archaeon]
MKAAGIVYTLKEGFIAVALSAVFFLAVLYPNIPLTLEQLGRQSIGIDGLAGFEGPQLSDYADKVIESGEKPEAYIDRTIHYASDFDVWWNFDYWETPEEVLSKGRTDCEGKAVLTKAVYNEVNRKGGFPEKEEVEIKAQQQHVYVEVRKPDVNETREIYKIPEKSGLEKTVEGFLTFVDEIPFVRQAILAAGLAAIWGRYVLRARGFYRKRKKT